MQRSTVMVVEDNPLTRKVVRVALHSEGFAVVEAENGAAALALFQGHQPRLVLQDLVLPDIDGLELVKKLRALPDGTKLPILAFSAFPSKLAEARQLEGAFTDYITKPVEPSRLVAIIRTYLLPRIETVEQPGRGRRVLVVDDDPVQRKLVRIHLEQLGFTVATAEDGLDALEQARSKPPDGIVSDMLMPRLDGFKLCLAIRQDAQLARIPVVLTSSAYIEEADRRLAESAGATCFVVREPDLRNVINGLLVSMNLEAPARPAELPKEEYTDRIVKQLERQSGLSADLVRKLAWLEAKLEILTGLTETLKREAPTETLVDEILQRTLEAAGAPLAAAYLFDPAGQLRLRGVVANRPADARWLDRFFGQSDRLQEALASMEPVEIPIARLGAVAQKRLAKPGVNALLVVPLLVREERLGALVLGRAGGEQVDDLAFFATAIASQVSQAIALTRALARLQSLKGIADTALVNLTLDDLLSELLGKISTAIGSDTAAVLLLEGDSLVGRIAKGLGEEVRRGVRLPLGTGFAGRVAAERKPVLIEHVTPADVFSPVLIDTGIRSLLGVPLLAEGRVIGVLHVGTRHDRRFGADDVQFLQLVAERVASVVERARLFEAEHQARTAAEAAQRRLAFLAKASRVLVATLDYEATLANVVRLTVPDFAAICLVDVVRADGAIATVASAFCESAQEALVHEIKRCLPESTEGGAVVRVIASGEAAFYPEIDHECLAAYARDERHFEMLRALAPRSAMILPLIAHGRILGAVTFASCGEDRRFDADDFETATELAHRCALALENARLYQESQAALHLRDEFLSIAAHELKTPITSLRGFAQVLLRQFDNTGAIDPLRAQRVVTQFDRQSERLAKLIGQLLDISRLEAGRLAIAPEPTDITLLVKELVENVKQAHPEHDIVVNAPEALPASVDRLRIEQVITNLIDNAVKFSPKGSSIEIEVAARGEAAAGITIRDHGIGIPVDKQAHLFERFFQAHIGGHYGGLGLGLYISRQIIELHGGSIVAECPEDGGTSIVLHLPRAVATTCPLVRPTP